MHDLNMSKTHGLITEILRLDLVCFETKRFSKPPKSTPKPRQLTHIYRQLES